MYEKDRNGKLGGEMMMIVKILGKEDRREKTEKEIVGTKMS